MVPRAVLPPTGEGLVADHGLPTLLGRKKELADIRSYLSKRHNVLLLGPRDVGKSAVIHALNRPDLMVIDPFMGVSPRFAGQIRHAIDRGTQCIAATRSVNRAEMGAVRRLAFWFTTVRISPLSAHWIKRVLYAEYAAGPLAADVVTPEWTDAAVQLARGRPGLALAIVRAAASLRERLGFLPSPRVAYVDASIRRVELHRGNKGRGEGGKE